MFAKYLTYLLNLKVFDLKVGKILVCFGSLASTRQEVI